MLAGRRFLVVSFLFVGCTKANPSATCGDGTCTDPSFPYCDVDGSVGGVPGECVAVSCTPGEIKECRGDMAFTCSATGNGYELQPCDLGCSDVPTSHCKYLQPKYLPDICDAAANVASLLISSSGTLDPNLDASCTGGVVPQGGADLCIVRATTIEIASGAVLTVVGSQQMNGRAIAFVADSDLSIHGAIDVGAHTAINGPGGGTFVSGGIFTFNPQTAAAGGAGGAGGATAGGAGATGDNMGGGIDNGAANGGAPSMNPALLASFVGGASTPRFYDQPNSPDQVFGGGGGALTLVSCHGTVIVDGILTAGGGGGAAASLSLLPIPSRGGGAGGNIVLQGRHVVFTGQAFANGGAGGQGWNQSGTMLPGADGSMSDTAGAIGGNILGGAGVGGTGGWIGQAPTGGKHPTANVCGPGAGGGSVGFLQIYTPMDTTPSVTPAHVSPAFQPNGIVETR
jgi:hypothetical protein